MKSKTLRLTAIILFVIGILCFLWLLIMPYPLLLSPKQSSSKPEYIVNLWPPPESEIWIGYYNLSLGRELPFQRGISVTIQPASIIYLEFPGVYNANVFLFIDRISMNIDGKQISNSSRTYLDNGTQILGKINDQTVHYDVSTEYSISWAPKLSRGNHIAKLVIETQAGIILEFEWHFRIS